MTLLLALGIVLLFSAFFSAAEMAFLSTDRVKLRNEAERGDVRARRLLVLFEDSREFLTTVLIGNNLLSVIAAALLTAFFDMRFRIQNEWVVTAVLAPILVIFCETVPKGYGRYQGSALLKEHLTLTFIFWKIFSWPTRALLAASELFLGKSSKDAKKNIFVNEDEFRFLIEESVRSGVLEEHEKKFVERILDFERVPVERVMTPVAAVPQIELSGNVKEAKEKARKTHSKILLVYEEIPSIVIGMIYVFDLLFETNETKGLASFLRSPIFLPMATPLEKAFLTLQEKRQSFALVTDARREVIGVINIENLIAL